MALAACLCAWVAPAAAKTPEEFVGPASVAKAAKPDKATPPETPKAKPEAPSSKAASTAATTPGKAKPSAPVLDTARIHAIYLDGDFDKATHILEDALKSGKDLDHADSVFIFKHLGVIYAANPDTRDKGRFYMLQLVSIEPTAKILDMYASDMIFLIFRNVQEEYEKKHPLEALRKAGSAAAVDVAAAPAAKDSAAPVPAAARPAYRNGRSALYWAVGGAAVAAGATGLLFILLDNPSPKKRTIVLNE